MKNYRYVLFDWNGTLINDLEINIGLCNTLLARRNLPLIEDKNFYLENFEFPIKLFYDMLGFDWSVDSYEDIAVEYGVIYAKAMEEAKLFPDVLPLLKKLKSQGVTMAIVSASMQERLDEQVQWAGIEEYFDAKLGAGDNLGESKVARCKKWFEQNHADPAEVLFVGDTTHDAETAFATGCDCILISRGHNSRQRLEKMGCGVYDSLAEAFGTYSKIILAPDSFKGTLSATEVCNIVGDVITEKLPECEVKKIPIADGGEGTVDAYLSIFGGEKVYAAVHSPLGKVIKAYYGRLKNDVAVIEMAQASGLTIEKQNDALLASTYGTGELIKHALDNGAKKIILGLGGSATTDGGVGCVQALGGKFTDADGREIPHGGKYLKLIESIDLTGLDSRLADVGLTVLCDVKNPLYGTNGAAYVYSRQKGAGDKQIEQLDSCLKHLAEKSAEYLGEDYSKLEGTGAAGGMGFATLAFLGGKLQSGIDCVLENADFENEAKSADLVITGEGRMDSQSLMGKAPFGVAKRAGNTKVIAIVGLMDADGAKAAELGISEIYETNPTHRPFEEIIDTASVDLRKTAQSIFE